MITPTNQVKNIIVPDNREKGFFYLLTESGDFLTLEDGGLIMLDASNYSVSATNQIKHPFGSTTIYAGTPMGLLLTLTYPTTFSVGSGVTNQAKS